MPTIDEQAFRGGIQQASGGAGPSYDHTPGIAEQLGLVPAGRCSRVIDLSNPDPGGGRVAVEGGTASAVIDLANPSPPRRGGRGPDVPWVLTGWRVTGLVRIGHTADFADQDAPIIIREADDVRPGADGTGYVEGRCRTCVAHPHLAVGEDQTIMILEHERGCPEMEGLLRRAGLRS
jgi:hypothetical protein